VGHSKINDGTFRAFLWENSGPMIDLNALIPLNSSLILTDAQNINEQGEIAGLGVPAGCQPADVEICGHAFLLIPDGECDDDCEGRIAASQNNAAMVRRNAAEVTEGAQSRLSPIERLRSQMRQRYHVPGQRPAPRE
jgi:probable HAF family extracellular repeat protein